MFQTLVTLATLLATSAHALFGCCWHHGHVHRHAGVEVAESADHQAEGHHKCSCQHAAKTEGHEDSEPSEAVVVSAEQDPCGHSDGHESGECEGRCLFLTNAKVELPTLDGPHLSGGLLACTPCAAFHAPEHLGLLTHALSASLLSGSLCVRDLTQIARI